jgi:hypothetical protein
VYECIIDGCENPHGPRGLCEKHYKRAVRAVRCGDTTWDSLVSQGLAKEAMALGSVNGHKGPEKSELALLYRGNQQLIDAHLGRVRERILGRMSA